MPTPTRIEKMIYGGHGVTSTGDSIPFVLPNELIEIKPSHDIELLEPSPDRIASTCIHFTTCGGCHYQHATYPAQLRIKQSILSDALASAGLTNIPAIETHSADPWHYRNRIRLRIGELDGQLRIGYNRYDATGGDPLLPISMCPIAAPLLISATMKLLDLAASQPAVHSWLASAIELELFTNATEAALQLTLFTRKPPVTSFPAFAKLAQQAIPQLTGAGVALLPRKPALQGRRFEHPKPGPQWGTPGLIYTAGPASDPDNHWVSRGAFFQVNRHLVSTLTALATSGRTGALAWDLYAGVGLFSRALTRSFSQVIAVEAAEPAANDLAAALKSKPHRAVAMTTLDFLNAAVVQRERPDLIVMDPPRAGIGTEVCTLLARVRCPHLVYVSCDPVTLARDLAQLTTAGYTLTALHLVDMFPQTFHMESVAILHL